MLTLGELATRLELELNVLRSQTKSTKEPRTQDYTTEL